MRGPGTDAFHTEVWTIFSRHATSRGRPTFTETNRGIIHLRRPAAITRFALRAARRPPASGAMAHEELPGRSSLASADGRSRRGMATRRQAEYPDVTARDR